MKKRIGAVILSVIATTAVVFAAYAMELNPPILFICGAYAALAVGVLVAWLFKITDDLFYTGLVFIFLASPIGSVMNLYRSFGPYDKIIHYFSGILLAAFGMMIVTRLLGRKGLTERQIKIVLPVCVLFAFFFASAGAGLWEIYEFTTDRLSGSGMQRGMVDTLTDMIAGNFGGLTYAIYAMIART